MDTYPITDTNTNHELQHIRTILHNNNYSTYKYQIKPKQNNIEQNTQQETNKNMPPSHIPGNKQESSRDYLKTQTYEYISKPQTL
jgi:hypothetical protein